MDPKSQAPSLNPAPAGQRLPPEKTRLPSTGPQEAPTDLSFEARTPVPEGDTHLGWPRPISGRVGPYELLEEIAQGGMGIVYKARDTRLGRVVALKTMRADALRQPGAVPRFQREMQAAAQLNHPNIVAVYEVGDHQGQPFYTMAYLAGGTLGGQRDRLLGEHRTVVALMEKVARGVEHAHDRHVFHRDLKPANVLIDERGEPQISDFGLAKFRDGDLDLTRTGAVLGTIPYMSPEQAAGRGKDAGPSADVWALGVMLFELLTGQRPFGGDGGEEVKRRILREDPPRPRTLRPSLDRDLEIILFKCLEKSPQLRYTSAGALADDLHRYLQGESIRPPRLAVRLFQTIRRHIVAEATVLGVGLAAIALSWYRQHTDPNRPLGEYGRQWASGKPLTLITEKGSCPWKQWTFLPGQLFEPPQHPAFHLASMEHLSLLELLPDPPAEGYRLRAQIGHDESSGETGMVGIYFPCGPSVGPGGKCNAFCTLRFSDRATYAVSHRVDLDVWREVDGNPVPNRLVRRWICDPCLAASTIGFMASPLGQGPVLEAYALVVAERPSYPLPSNPSPWRDLEVELTPGAVRVFWMKEKLGEFDPANVLSHSVQPRDPNRPARPGGPSPTPRLAAGNGLGLCIGRASATFREVVVEPLRIR